MKLAVCQDAACVSPSIEVINSSLTHASHSLVLSESDLPRIIWRESGLVLAVCRDTLGSICPQTQVGETTDAGANFSLALNANGFPVFSHYRAHDGNALGLVSCNDVHCLVNPSLEIVDADFGISSTSMKLNINDFPIIGYSDYINDSLNLARCNNTDCTDAALTVVDDSVIVDSQMSLDLNSNGFPVISYFDASNQNLMLAKCNDEACTVRTLRTVDTAGSVERWTSLGLNHRDFPVISYFDGDYHDLKVAACNDTTCINPSITTVDRNGATGLMNSLRLNTDDLPVVAYSDFSNGHLRLAICNICVPSIQTTVDSAGSVGQHTSMALHNGKPVISYTDTSNGALKLARCANESCSDKTLTTVDTIGGVNAIGSTSLALNSSGFAVISYYDDQNNDLELAICNDATCSNPILKTVDGGVNRGKDSSLALNSNGHAVISYYDEENFELKLAICNDAVCSNPSISTVDGSSTIAGGYTSLVLNESGFPVISYHSWTDDALMLAICGDATCSAANSIIRIVDDATSGEGRQTSLALNSNGFAVISYYDSGLDDLKLAVCNDASCSQPTVVPIDETGDVGRYTNLALTIDDYPIISYRDSTNQKLKVAVCSDIACTSPTLTSVDQSGNVGVYNSMALNSRGYPVLSYYAGSPDADLKVAIFDLDGISGIFSDGFESGSTAAWIP